MGGGRSSALNFGREETWTFGVDRNDEDNNGQDVNATTTTTNTTTTTASIVPPMNGDSNDDYDYGGGREEGYCRCSFCSKAKIRRTRMTRGTTRTMKTTIATAGETRTIAKTTATITLLRKVYTYPPIERKRRRKKGPTRRSPSQRKTNTNTSPLPPPPHHRCCHVNNCLKNKRRSFSFTYIGGKKRQNEDHLAGYKRRDKITAA